MTPEEAFTKYWRDSESAASRADAAEAAWHAALAYAAGACRENAGLHGDECRHLLIELADELSPPEPK